MESNPTRGTTSQTLQAAAYFVLFFSTIFVNKYVLSILKFTYPTIFQGWQTLVGAVVIRVLGILGRIEQSTTEITRSNVIPYTPAMILFVIAICAGSKALSVLPIPVFLAIAGSVDAVTAAFESLYRTKDFHLVKILAIASVFLSSLLVALTDPKFQLPAYGWMAVFVASSGLRSMYKSTLESVSEKNKTENLNEMNYMLVEYVFSLIVLAPSSYMLGDILAAKEFPFFYLYKFYVGCVLSGVCGVLLSMCAMYLNRDSAGQKSNRFLYQYHNISKVCAILLSTCCFQMEFSLRHVLSISICLLASMVLRVHENGEKCTFTAQHKKVVRNRVGLLKDTPTKTAQAAFNVI